MYKNQLQELAQRSSCNLPSYSCLREGPDHAPRFKATVNFNGDVFESPGYCSTLRQAEHAAAEVALNVLSQKGPAQSLAAKVLDETGVCKNLLQETAQRAGVFLPVYTTFRSGPGHLPVFTSTVEVAGFQFTGEPAKTKKQAEKNAALAAWTRLKRVANHERVSVSDHDFSSDEQEQNSIARALAFASSKNLSKSSSFSNNPSDEKRLAVSVPMSPVWPTRDPSSKQSLPSSHSNSKTQAPLQQKRTSTQNSPLVQTSRTGLVIKPGMAYQPRLSSAMAGVSNLSMRTPQKPPSMIVTQQRQVMSAQAEHDADEELWLRGSSFKKDSTVSSHLTAVMDPSDLYSDKIWEPPYWASNANDGTVSRDSLTRHISAMKSPVTSNFAPRTSMSPLQSPSMGIMPPVRIRSLIPVHASPRFEEEDDYDEEDEDEEEELRKGESTTIKMLSQLGL